MELTDYLTAQLTNEGRLHISAYCSEQHMRCHLTCDSLEDPTRGLPLQQIMAIFGPALRSKRQVTSPFRGALVPAAPATPGAFSAAVAIAGRINTLLCDGYLVFDADGVRVTLPLTYSGSQVERPVGDGSYIVLFGREEQYLSLDEYAAKFDAWRYVRPTDFLALDARL